MRYGTLKDLFEFVQREIPNEETPEWKNYSASMEALLSALKPFETPDKEGRYPSISTEDYVKLDGLFDQAAKDSQAYLNQFDNVIDPGVKVDVVRNINDEFFAKAYVEFKNVTPSQDVSLHDAMENYLVQTVELGDEEIQKLGENLSSRTKMSILSNGEKVQGVFTARSHFKGVEDYHDMVARIKEKYPRYAEFFSALDNDEFYESQIYHVNTDDFVDPQNGPSGDHEQACDDFFTGPLGGEEGPVGQLYLRFRQEPEFYGALMDFAKEGQSIGLNRAINEGTVGMGKNENIDSRNSAMSGIANLLGVPSLIARSKPLEIHTKDGKSYVQGTFMEEAKGKDINHLPAVDEMRIAQIGAYENPSLMKSVADLQVLDYICGNIDRHAANMFYQFDPKTHQCIGVQGIDNDASFIKTRVENNESANRLPGINRMRVIDQETADKVLSLTEGQLKATLHGYGMNKKAIDAAWQRTLDLQHAIKDAQYYNPQSRLPEFDENDNRVQLRIVSKDAWKSMTLQEAASQTGNTFSLIKGVQRMMTAPASADKGLSNRAHMSKASLKTMLSPKQAEGLMNKAKSAKPWFGTSARYSNVLRVFKEYQEMQVDGNPLFPQNAQKFAKLQELKTMVDTYKREKKDLGHITQDGKPSPDMKGDAKIRIEAVDQIGRFADEILAQKERADKDAEAVKADERKVREVNYFLRKSPEDKRKALAEINPAYKDEEPVVEASNVNQPPSKVSVSLSSSDSDIEIIHHKKEKANEAPVKEEDDSFIDKTLEEQENGGPEL